ncbi:MAG: DEAD/DEAH box helicase [Bacteroidales bacterium]|nr:DEAD/DEAH box helicase [Bacteroidales bacterium]
MKRFVVTVRNHRTLGYILAPYIIEESENQEFFKIVESVVAENISLNPEKYTDFQQEIVKIAENYSDTQIRKTYGGRKYTNNNDFLKQLTPEYINDYIRPSIDKKIIQIIDICKQNGIRLYFKHDNLNSIFPEDEIIISSRLANAVFNFTRLADETRYFLSVRYKNKDVTLLNKAVFVLSNNPCYIILGDRLYMFEDIDAKKFMPFTVKEYVSVAKRVEEQYYQKFIKNAITSGAVVRAEGFKIENLKVFPQAILSVERDLTGETIFQLYFRYNDIDFKIDSPNKIVVKLINKNDNYTFTKLVRDIQSEADIEEETFKIFPNRINPGVFKVKAQGNDHEVQRAFAINALNANKDRLTEAGISIQLVGFEKVYYTGKIDIAITVNRNEDWFDVYAVVKLDDIEIPFISLKYYILNNIREFSLPDGKVVILPEEWFERYKALFASGVINKETNSIQLKNYQYSALSSLPLETSLQERIHKLENDLLDMGHLPKDQPKSVNATLRPYQVTAFNWLKMMRNYNFGACLADDMGLGKTLCTLSLLSESTVWDKTTFEDGLFSFPTKIPSLLFVPKSLIYNWVNEAKKFVPNMKILEFVGQNRGEMVKSFPLYDLIITGYGTLRNDVEILAQHQFNYIILDESQVIKNSTSKTYQSLLKLKSNHRLTLTGTPLENSLTDLWSQINFLNPGLLGNLQIFKKRFVNPIEKNHNEETSKRLKHLIYPFILRRTKQQVLNDLPELMEQTILCDMTETQKELYEREKSKVRNSILEIVDNGVFEKSAVTVLQALTKLRQLSCNPSMIDNDYQGGSGKSEEIIYTLINIISQGHKVLIFSSFVQHLKLIAGELVKNDIGYSMLTGSTENREAEVKKFNSDEVSVFLISIKAGGTGLNLTQADYVFIIDPWWNPAVEDQAVARAHRMGQKNSVMVYRFISKDTIEEKIQRYQRKKADLADAFVSETTEFSADLKEEVLRILE